LTRFRLRFTSTRQARFTLRNGGAQFSLATQPLYAGKTTVRGIKSEFVCLYSPAISCGLNRCRQRGRRVSPWFPLLAEHVLGAPEKRAVISAIVPRLFQIVKRC